VAARVEGVDGGEKKQTQVATGSKPTFNQTLEFVVTPSEGVRSCGGDIVLCVWDKYLFKECLVRGRPLAAPCRLRALLQGHHTALRCMRAGLLTHAVDEASLPAELAKPNLHSRRDRPRLAGRRSKHGSAKCVPALKGAL
jgi:hypothetical protein